jgi:hypothetical protein
MVEKISDAWILLVISILTIVLGCFIAHDVQIIANMSWYMHVGLDVFLFAVMVSQLRMLWVYEGDYPTSTVESIAEEIGVISVVLMIFFGIFPPTLILIAAGSKDVAPLFALGGGWTSVNGFLLALHYWRVINVHSDYNARLAEYRSLRS